MELGRLMLFGCFAWLLALTLLVVYSLLLEMLAFTCLSGVGDSEGARYGKQRREIYVPLISKCPTLPLSTYYVWKEARVFFFTPPCPNKSNIQDRTTMERG